MVKFYICVAVCLIACTILLLAFGLRFDHILTSIYNVLCKILGNVRPIDSSIQNVWCTIIDIRKDTAKITGLLDKDEEEPEENTDADISEEGWTMAPCPVCGGPARMRYDHDSMGYFVQCGRNAGYNTCDYGNIAGGSTRKIAAEMWNNSVVNYCRMKMGIKEE